MPVDGQAWSADPFTLRRADGRLYARGAADMKGFVSACLAAVPDFKARNLARPLHLFISYDEEVGCCGAQRLMQDLDEFGLKPALCVVGEPSGMQPILAHKGKLNLRVRVRGLHRAFQRTGKGVNAIQAAGEAIAYIAAEARRLAQEGPFEDGFDPPHTTIHVGTVQGGTILNIIPERCEFVMEWRTIPGDDATRHVERMRAFVARDDRAGDARGGPRHRVRLRGARPRCRAWRSTADHELTAIVKQLTGSNSTGKVSYGTEGGYYQEAGIPTIICGPGHIAQAHQPDEWIAQDQLDACDALHPPPGRPAAGLMPARTDAVRHPPLPEFEVRIAAPDIRRWVERQHRHPRLHHAGFRQARSACGAARRWCMATRSPGAIVLDRLLAAPGCRRRAGG